MSTAGQALHDDAARLLLLCEAPERAEHVATALDAAQGLAGARGRRWALDPCLDIAAAVAAIDDAEVLLVDLPDPYTAIRTLRSAAIDRPLVAVLRAGDDGEVLAAVADELITEDELTPLVLERTLRVCDTARTLTGRVEFLAQRDVLTGLPNRRLFERQLELALRSAERHDRRLAVGSLGLDGFAELAASLGQTRTEHLLVVTARRIAAVLRRSDLVARAHEDCFLLMLELPGDATDLAAAAAKLLDAIAEPLVLEGAQVDLRGSLGMAVYPSAGDSATDLLRESEAALADVRAAGGDDFRFFDAQLELVTRQRLLLDAALPGAIDRGEFSVRYQPRLDLASMRITGAEVLARWHSPEFGDVSPEQFIPLAEDSGAIGRVGGWVLQTALGDLRRWQDAGHRVHLGVNVSAGQFRGEDFPGRVRRELDAAGVAPEALELEITERVLVENVTEHLSLFDELTALGIGIAIDDFGIGYSSLAYLKHFPVHSLKIDRAFVSPLPESQEDAAIVRAIVALGHALGLRVVAEGVESEAQLEFLRGAGCDEAQGFLIGQGCAAWDFEAMLVGGGAPEREAQP